MGNITCIKTQDLEFTPVICWLKYVKYVTLFFPMLMKTGMILKTTASSPITVNPNPLMSTAVNVKATGTIVTQASSQIGGKPIMQRQSSQPLVIGQLGRSRFYLH